MNSPRFAMALAAGKLCAALCKAFFPKRGSNLPGAAALKLDPLFLRHVSGIDPAKTIFITGSNGKSTANNMVVHAFEAAGLSICSNIEGANMKAGVATALVKNTAAGGCFKKDYLCLEVDERSLAQVADDIPPGHICVTNIQKDQVQRNGDPDYIYQKIKAVTGRLGGLTLYVNNDEPRSKSLGMHISESSHAVTFGVRQNARSYTAEADWGVTMPCPLCHDKLVFAYYNIDGVGAFACPACGFVPDESPRAQITGADFEGGVFTSAGDSYRLAYPAAYFLYNYALCLCVCAEFGIGADTLKRAFETFTNIGGRMESFSHKGKDIKYMRIKQENPETLQSAIGTMAEDKGEKAVALGPAVIDDMVPHYSNTFYTFDCNFGPLIESGVERFICFGSTIGWDMANRLRYAGVPDERIEVVDTDDEGKILDAFAACGPDNIYLITWIKKFETLKGRAS